MLLEPRGRGEGLPAVRAGVRPRAHVLRADVPLQVAGVREHLRRQTLCLAPALCVLAAGRSLPAALPSAPSLLWVSAATLAPWVSQESCSGLLPSQKFQRVL